MSYIPGKQTVPTSVVRRQYPGQNYQVAQVGDRPWFCWFNETAFEFFIYVNQKSTPSGANSATAQATGTLSTSVSTTPSVNGAPPHPTAAPGNSGPNFPRRDSYSTYPLAVKMEEKRTGQGVQPYCQLMQILDNGEIVPVGSSPTIAIQEVEPTSTPNRRSVGIYDGSTTSLDSHCVCEWLDT